MKREDRPNHKDWKPLANSGDDDRTESYLRAAKRLGIEITISYPVPCSAGAGWAASLGQKGIYIKRDQSDRADELSSQMFRELKMLSE